MFKTNSLSDAVIYLLSNILVAAIPFILLPFLTRYLTPDEYGQIAMFQVLIGALSALVGLSVHTLVGRKYYDDISKLELAKFVGVSLQLVLIIGSALIFLMYYLKEIISDFLAIPEHWLMFGIVTTVSIAVIQIRLILWQVSKAAVRYGTFQVGQAFLNLVITVILVFVMTLGAEGRILAQAVAGIVFLLFAIIWLKIDGMISFLIWKPKYFKEIIRFGVPLIPHVAGIFLLVSIDRVIIAKELGLSAAGIYMVGIQVSMIFTIVFDAVNKAYVPWLYERLKLESREVKQKVVRISYIGFIICLFIGFVSFFISPLIIPFVVGEEYFDVENILGWLILGQIFSGMYMLMANYIFYSKKTGLLSLITITSGVINIGLLFIFVRYLGLEGASIAFCFAMIIRFFLTWLIANLRYPMPWFKFVK